MRRLAIACAVLTAFLYLGADAPAALAAPADCSSKSELRRLIAKRDCQRAEQQSDNSTATRAQGTSGWPVFTAGLVEAEGAGVGRPAAARADASSQQQAPAGGSTVAPQAAVPPAPLTERADCYEGPNAFAMSYLQGGPACARASQAVAIKTSAANTYDSYLKGIATKEDMFAADAKVAAITGAEIPPPAQNIIARDSGRDPLGRPPSSNPVAYEAYQQINDYYCGPATAQSILMYFARKNPKYAKAATYDEESYQQNFLLGLPRDQIVLANKFWLSTKECCGTNWGNLYLPFTLNAWRGDSYYQLQATAAANGPMDKEQFIRSVRYSIDRGFPIAANIRYNADSFFPAGFTPTYDYGHWDTIYGYYEVDGVTYIQQGQVFANRGNAWVPYQDIPLETYWTALGQHRGIVW